MELSHWLSLASICLLGAMSPGPSLAIVMQTTLTGGRTDGIRFAVSHGAGVALYALLTVTGLATLITNLPQLYLSIQLVGALYLLYLGWVSLRSTGGSLAGTQEHAQPNSQGNKPYISGFLIAFGNPKLAIFMLALFSQLLSPQADLLEKSIMVATAGVIDGAWYCLAATLFAHPRLFAMLQRRSQLIERGLGVLLVLLATAVLLRAAGVI